MPAVDASLIDYWDRTLRHGRAEQDTDVYAGTWFGEHTCEGYVSSLERLLFMTVASASAPTA